MEEVRKYHVNGYHEYQNIEKDLHSFLSKIFGDDNIHFRIAINEAVCNTAKHTNVDNNGADIEVVVTNNAVDVIVRAKTFNFDAKEYKKKLLELAQNKRYQVMDWGTYTEMFNLGMGFWYMMSGVDYLIVERDGSSITLSTALPFIKGEPVTQIGKLVPRFFVRDRGVIA